MTRQRTLIVSLCMVALAAGTASAELKIGDDAPKLSVKKWVKGDPVDLSKGDKIYVVEFWATWCGPCLRSIPHLSKLQEKHKDDDVVVIGISSADRSLETVEKFVKAQGDKMAYTVAYESSENPRTSKAYMDAFKVRGIPHAFVVDKKGDIVWQGHPMFGLDEVIEAVIKGDYTPESLKRIADEVMEQFQKLGAMLDQYFRTASSTDDKSEIQKLGHKLFEAAHENPDMMNHLSWEILTNPNVKWRDLSLALKAAEAAMKGSGGQDAAVVDTYARALFDNGRVDAAIEQQKKAVELAKDNEPMREALAETLEEYKKAKKEQARR